MRPTWLIERGRGRGGGGGGGGGSVGSVGGSVGSVGSRVSGGCILGGVHEGQADAGGALAAGERLRVGSLAGSSRRSHRQLDVAQRDGREGQQRGAQRQQPHHGARGGGARGCAATEGGLGRGWGERGRTPRCAGGAGGEGGGGGARACEWVRAAACVGMGPWLCGAGEVRAARRRLRGESAAESAARGRGIGAWAMEEASAAQAPAAAKAASVRPLTQGVEGVGWRGWGGGGGVGGGVLRRGGRGGSSEFDPVTESARLSSKASAPRVAACGGGGGASGGWEV